MNEFELKLNNTTYKCSGNQADKHNQNWTISAELEGLRVHMTVPIESKLTRLQVMGFVERFHEAMIKAKEDQKPLIEYT